MRAEVFAAQYGITRTTVLQNRPEAPASEQAAVNLHRSLEIPDGQLIFLYQGGLQQGRGLEQILDAAAETDGACFVFIGSGALDPALRAKAAQLGIEDRVRIHAAVPWQELASWTAGADVGLQLLQNTCLNHYTTDSNKIFEYAVAGLPVVASDFPEIRKIVSSWGFGLLVDPSNHQELVERFRALVSDEPLRQQLKEAALRAAPELTWNTQAPLLIDLYEKIDESRARRARA
jgi:glycosyltransferase involved in cell wall biosynthesis